MRYIYIFQQYSKIKSHISHNLVWLVHEFQVFSCIYPGKYLCFIKNMYSSFLSIGLDLYSNLFNFQFCLFRLLLYFFLSFSKTSYMLKPIAEYKLSINYLPIPQNTKILNPFEDEVQDAERVSFVFFFNQTITFFYVLVVLLMVLTYVAVHSYTRVLCNIFKAHIAVRR